MSGKGKNKARSKSPVARGRKSKQSKEKLEVIDSFYPKIEYIRFINASEKKDKKACKAADDKVHNIYNRAVDKLMKLYPPGLLECPTPGKMPSVSDQELKSRSIERPPVAKSGKSAPSEGEDGVENVGADPQVAEGIEGDAEDDAKERPNDDFPEPPVVTKEEEELAAFIQQPYDNDLHRVTGNKKTDYRNWAISMVTTIKQGVWAKLTEHQMEAYRFRLHEVRPVICCLHSFTHMRVQQVLGRLRHLLEVDHRRKAPKDAVERLMDAAFEAPGNKKTQIQKYYMAEHHDEYIAALRKYQESEEGRDKHPLTQQADTLKRIWNEKSPAWLKALTEQRDAEHAARLGSFQEKQAALLTGMPKNRDWGL
jgi:hypothetical protein